MVAAYTEEDIEELKRNLEALRNKTDQVLIFASTIQFSNLEAKTFAFEGLSRRLQMLTEAIIELFAVIPPEMENKPNERGIFLASALLHSIVINSYGAIDNLAHIWGKEFPVSKSNGRHLALKEISIFHRDRVLLRSIGGDFADLVESRTDWFEYLQLFRNQLAHQIPPYIPSTLVDPDHEATYIAFEQERWSADVSDERLAEIDAELLKITHFKPMLHIRPGINQPILFHAQVICDYLTIEELSMALLRTIRDRCS